MIITFCGEEGNTEFWIAKGYIHVSVAPGCKVVVDTDFTHLTCYDAFARSHMPYYAVGTRGVAIVTYYNPFDYPPIDYGSYVRRKAAAAQEPTVVYGGKRMTESEARKAAQPKYVSNYDLNTPSIEPVRQNNSPLHDAVKNGDVDEVRKLLENGANPNVKNGYGDTPLHEAVLENSVEIVTLLMDNGADPRIGNNAGMSPLALSKMTDSPDVQKLLQSRSVVKNPVPPMVEPAVIDKPIEEEEGNTPLHVAVLSKDIDEVRRLLENGSNPNVRNSSGQTPLHAAVYVKRVDILNLLIEFGANAKIGNKAGQTPMAYAAGLGWTEGINTLNPLTYKKSGKKSNPSSGIEGSSAVPSTHDIKPSSPSKPSKDGEAKKSVEKVEDSPLYAAVLLSKDIDEIRRLLENGSNPNVRNSSGQTPLHAAVYVKRVDILNLLIEFGANAKIGNKAGQTPLVCAEVSGWTEGINALQPFTPKKKNKNAKTAPDTPPKDPPNKLIHDAATSGNLAQLRSALEHGVDPNVLNEGKETPLFGTLRCLGDYEGCARLLLEKGADPNFRNSDGDTLLHCAVMLRCRWCVRLLLEHHANPNALNGSAKSPRDVCCDPEIKQLLMRYGGKHHEGLGFRILKKLK